MTRKLECSREIIIYRTFVQPLHVPGVRKQYSSYSQNSKHPQILRLSALAFFFQQSSQLMQKCNMKMQASRPDIKNYVYCAQTICKLSWFNSILRNSQTLCKAYWHLSNNKKRKQLDGEFSHRQIFITEIEILPPGKMIQKHWRRNEYLLEIFFVSNDCPIWWFPFLSSPTSQKRETYTPLFSD